MRANQNVPPVRLAYQPPASSTFLSEQTSHQQPANNTFLSEQTSTSHQPLAKQTGWYPLQKIHEVFTTSYALHRYNLNYIYKICKATPSVLNYSLFDHFTPSLITHLIQEIVQNIICFIVSFFIDKFIQNNLNLNIY
jgi:hypothetical protein